MDRLVLFVVGLIVCASCVKGTPLNPILPAGVSPTPLQQPEYVGVGRYQELGAMTTRPPFGGVPFATFTEVRLAAGQTLAHGDVPGFVYVFQGHVVVSREGGDTTRQQVIDQGAAGWVDAASEYVNGSNADQIWYFIALRSITQRGVPPPYPTYRSLYETPDLVQLPSDKQIVFQLGYITMDVGGRTSSHSHGGTESLYVLKGTVELATSDKKRVNVAAGQGASIKPGVTMQLRVVGNEPVQILTFFVTPEGAPWQTNLQTLP